MNCNSVWTTQNGVIGRKFISPNGGTIFLPAAGKRYNEMLSDEGWLGNYRTSTYENNPYYPWFVWGFYFDSGDDFGDVFTSNGSLRVWGLPVRPVRIN